MNEKPKTVLVYVGLDRVGDSLLKLPFVQGLRRANRRRILLGSLEKTPAFMLRIWHPPFMVFLDEVIDEAGIGLSVKELFCTGPWMVGLFDLIIDTQRVALATLVVYRIRHKAFISPFAKFALSTHKPPKGYVFPKSMQRQMLDLLEIATGDTVPTPAAIDLPVDKALVAAAADALPTGPVYVGLSPGAGGLPKCWPLEKFILWQRRRNWRAGYQCLF